MLKTIFKKTLLFLIVAIMALTPAVTFTAPVYAGTDNSYEEVKYCVSHDWFGETGSRFYFGNYDCDFVITYDEAKDGLSVVYTSKDRNNPGNTVFSLRIDIGSDINSESDIVIEYKYGKKRLKATAKSNLTELKSSKGITFEIKDAKGKDYSSKKKLQKRFRATFDIFMAMWDTVHYGTLSLCLYSIKDMGIKKYKNNTVTVTRHPGDYVCNGCGAQFDSWEEAGAHCDSQFDIAYESGEPNHPGYTCFGSGYQGTPSWDEYDPAWDEILSSLAKAVKKLK